MLVNFSDEQGASSFSPPRTGTDLTLPPSPGQDPNPAGLAAGTVASIILALVLLVVLLVVCGPLAYKKLVKKCRCHGPEWLRSHVQRLEGLH